MTPLCLIGLWSHYGLMYHMSRCGRILHLGAPLCPDIMPSCIYSPLLPEHPSDRSYTKNGLFTSPRHHEGHTLSVCLCAGPLPALSS